MDRSISLAQNSSGAEITPGAKRLETSIMVRPAALMDLPEIYSIYNHAVLNTTATFQETPESQTYPLQWFRSHQKSKLPILVASEQGVVGWASLSPYHPRSGYRYTAETSIYVREDRQGEGIGRALLRGLINEASILGIHKLVALIEIENVASIKLHKFHGFTEAGVLHEVGYKFGRWLDVMIMEKSITG
jgi:L-amino acid N-acyltransferase YncA